MGMKPSLLLTPALPDYLQENKPLCNLRQQENKPLFLCIYSKARHGRANEESEDMTNNEFIDEIFTQAERNLVLLNTRRRRRWKPASPIPQSIQNIAAGVHYKNRRLPESRDSIETERGDLPLYVYRTVKCWTIYAMWDGRKIVQSRNWRRCEAWDLTHDRPSIEFAFRSW